MSETNGDKEMPLWWDFVFIPGAFLFGGMVFSLVRYVRYGLLEVLGRATAMPALMALGLWPVTLGVVILGGGLVSFGLARAKRAFVRTGLVFLGVWWLWLVVVACVFDF